MNDTRLGWPRRRQAAHPTATAIVLGLVCATAGCGEASLPPAGEAPPTHELGPGEVCDTPEPEYVRARFEPKFIALAPGQQRSVRGEQHGLEAGHASLHHAPCASSRVCCSRPRAS